MLAGLIGSTFLPLLFPDTPPIYLFPILLIFSLAGCFAGVLLYPAESDEVLIHFYKKTRPWGFWKPVIAKIQHLDPTFIGNKTFKKDSFNVVIGIIWQMSQVVLPMYFMLRHNIGIAVSLILFLLTTYLLKINWFDRIDEEEKLI